MKAKNFKHQNVVFAEDQPEYISLPALKIGDEQGNVIFCMGLSFKERIKVIFTGAIWVNLLTFNKPLTPSYHSVNRKDVFSIPFDDIGWKEKLTLFINLGAIIYSETF